VLRSFIKTYWNLPEIDLITEEEVRRHMTRVLYFRALVSMLLFTAAVALFVAFGVLSTEPLSVLISLSAATALGLWSTTWRFRHVAPFILIVLFLLLGIYGTVVGGMVSTSMLFYVVAVLLASHLIDRTAMWIILGISLAAHYTLGLLRERPALPDALAGIIPSLGAMLGIALLEYYVAEVRDRVLATISRNTNSLEDEIVERYKAEDALRQSELHYRNLFEMANDAIIIFEPETEVVLEVNRRATELYGYSRDEFIGMSLKTISQDVVRGEEQIRDLMQSGTYQAFESVQWRKDGSALHLLINSSVIDFQGKRAVLSINRDITERQHSEEAMRHAQKMESLGVMAGGIAHDFNNLLQAILGQIALASNKVDLEHPARRHIEKTERAAMRASELTQQLLAYSGRGRFQVKRLQLNDLLKENLHLLEVSIPKTARITCTLQDDLWDVEADPGQMQQLVMNLILNAGEAIGDKPGTIHLRTHMQEIEAGDGAWSGGTRDPLAGGRYIVLECEDTGVGMDEETMNRIFDPFFTTKFTGRGLGLSAVQGIIRGHNGGLKVQSKRGAGTTFTIALPARLPEMKQGAEALSPVLLDVSGKILVIDDESFVRDVVVDILQSAGVEVLQADGGEMGIAMFRKYRDQIAAVLLDLSMPGMNGEETFRQLRAVDPNVRVIVSSGYSETEAMASFEPAGVASFIQKPYKGETLLSTLKTVLGR